jgi:hypothetical protein
MALQMKDLRADVREEAVPFLLGFGSGILTVAHPVYPPPNVDWRLVQARYALWTPIGVSEEITLILKDAAGNAIATTVTLAGALATDHANASGLFTLTTSDPDKLEARSSEGNAYHTVTPGVGHRRGYHLGPRHPLLPKGAAVRRG